MAELERDIQNRARETLEGLGFLNRRLTRDSGRGQFDDWYLRNGICVALEMKRPGGIVSPHQQHEQVELGKFGMPSMIAFTHDDAVRGVVEAYNATVLRIRRSAYEETEWTKK